MPPKSQRKPPRHPKSAPHPIAPRPTNLPPTPALTAVPLQNAPQKPYIPLPIALTHKMNTLITLSRRLESILHGLSYGLFATPTEHRDAQARLAQLRGVYSALRPQIDHELAALGYLSSAVNSNIPPRPASTKRGPPPQINTKGAAHAPHKHRYGPTSPQYTVDKALKRKADSQGRSTGTTSQRPAKKPRKDGAESDFVETDCEGEDEGSRMVEAEWPPEAITSLASVPLGRAEMAKIMGWSWDEAVKGKGEGRGVREEWVVSPLGTRVLW